MSLTVSVEASTVYALENGIGNYDAEDGSDLVLEGSSSMVDVTSTYLLHDSLTLKFNTLDFALLDPPPGSYELGAVVSTTDPTWSGTIVAAASSDPGNKVGHLLVRVTASNTNALPSDTAPFDLSDTPGDSTTDLLLEDGVNDLLLEAGTDFSSPSGVVLLEAALSYGYADLTVREQINLSDGQRTTLGTARVFQPGLRPGNLVRVTSADQGYSGAQYQINQVGVVWPGSMAQPFYEIEFGDTPQTLAAWTQLTAPTPAVPVTSPTTVPGGTTIYGKCSAGHKLWPQGGGIVTIASASFTVSSPGGGSLTVQLVGQIDCRAYAWDNYVTTPRRAVRAVISGGIYTGAWQETAAGTATTAGARGTFDLTSSPGISLPDGTYTVSIQIDTQEFNQLEVFSAYAQAAVKAA